jgi:chromate transporter
VAAFERRRPAPVRERSALDVFLTFLKLGLTSFGGPIAHLGYFREEFVVRRRWIDDAAYADLVALCQFLPGPASSQVGFSLGLMRAGYAGGVAAWTGFTLPSAVLLTAFAFGVDALAGPSGAGVLHGLKLVAVAIVAQAVWGMARSFCADPPRACIAAGSAVLTSLSGSSVVQIVAILAGGVAGLWFCRAAISAGVGSLGVPVSRRAGGMALLLFAVLLIGLPLLGGFAIPDVALFDAFYRSGALVFGGGHVVLPLLHDAVVAPGWVSDNTFLAGYGAAQAIPGPLFSFAAYLGAVILAPAQRLVGAATALVAVFLPGMLLLIGALPYWDRFRSGWRTQSAMRGINAAVVGLLGSALYNPVWTSSVRSAADVSVAVVGFVLLAWRAPPLLVVAMGALAGAALTKIPA